MRYVQNYETSSMNTVYLQWNVGCYLEYHIYIYIIRSLHTVQAAKKSRNYVRMF